MQGSTPLHCAAHSGDPDAIRAALSAGASLTAVDKYGAAPLHNAVFSGSIAAVEALLTAKADPGALMKNKFSLLHVAAQKGASKVKPSHNPPSIDVFL